MSKNLQENTCDKVSFILIFLIKLLACNFIKKETSAQVFSACNFIKNYYVTSDILWILIYKDGL